MEILFIVLLLAYIIGGAFWFFVNILEYASDYNHDDKRKHSKNAILTPIWPFIAIARLSLTIKKMWNDSGLADDLKKFQQNTQRGAK